MLRKLKKFIKEPHIFLRDALLNKYPLYLTHGASKFGRENDVIEICDNIEHPFSPRFDIDIVYTWVTSDDAEWLNKRNYYANNWEGGASPFAKEKSRFDDHNEIFFSLIGVGKFMPWVRNIYIVTDAQIPSVPESVKNKVFIIDHRDIIPDEFLPTFNSHVIEAFLYKIDGLSEHFIYFNDDFFVSKEVSASHFFQSNDIASLFIGNKEFTVDGCKKTATSIACHNSNALFMEEFGLSFNRNLVHTYVPLRKTYYQLAHENFGGSMTCFFPNKFRSFTDINMATFFVPYLQYVHGAAAPRVDISYYFNIRSPAADFFYDRLLDAKFHNCLPHSFCANDFSSEEFPQGNEYYKFNEFACKFYDCYI